MRWPPPSLKKTYVLGKIPVKNILKFVYDCKANLHFSDNEVKEILILYSDKHVILCWRTWKQNKLTLEQGAILRIRYSLSWWSTSAFSGGGTVIVH